MRNGFQEKRRSTAGPFGDLPVLILSRDPTVLSSNWPASVAKANSVVWNQMQEESKALSTQSIRIIAKRSDHYIQNDRPDLVIQEITTLVARIRNHQPFPHNQVHDHGVNRGTVHGRR